MRWIIWAVLLVSCATTPVVQAPAPTPTVAAAPQIVRPEKPTLRLPAGVKPTSYAIQATIVPGEPTFTAVTRVQLALTVATDRLWLNQSKLEFKAAHVEVGTRTIAATAKPEEDDFVLFELAEPIGPGAAVLEMTTVGELLATETDGLVVGGEPDTGPAVFSDFEPQGARRAFPVFDEPSFKVPWQLTLTAPVGLTVLSNTSPEKETVSGTMQTVTFARTTPLPSYLFALAVGPFDLVDGGKAGRNQIPVRIVVPKGQGARAAWAAETTKQCVDRLEAWFGTPIPYPKLDLIALTNAGFGGAMENPGLVTFSPGLLMSGKEGDSIGRKRVFLAVALHELAHQWFGNLVTAAWWDDIWLNESFAEFTQLDVLQAWKPEWEVGIDRVSTRNTAIFMDSVASTRRIREPIVNAGDVQNAFDGITYEKGASVLFMLERFIGKEAFRAGVRAHLAKHAHGNATATDFYASMSQSAGRDVAPVFSAFTDQAGVPMVHASVDCAGASPMLSLRQERYSPLGPPLPAAQWKVPVCVKWDGGRQCVLLESASATFKLEAPKCPTWVNFNDDVSGYYLVDPVTSAAITGPGLTVEERLGLAANLSSLVDRGDVSPVENLQLVPALVAGPRPLVEHASVVLGVLHSQLPKASQAKLAALTREHLKARWKAVGLEPKKGEDEEQQMLRSVLFSVLGTTGEDPAVRAAAVKLARAWLKDRGAVSPEVVGEALTIAGRTNDVKLYDEALAQLRVETDRQDRSRLRMLLGGATDLKLAERSLALLLDPAFDARENASLAWQLSSHEETRELMFAWLKKNYDAWMKRLPEQWELYAVSMATGLCSRERRAELVAFFEPRTTKALGGAREFAQAMEGYDQCVLWREKQLPAVIRYLNEWKPKK